MSSCLWLERPGRWRPLAAGAILLLATLPAGPLFWEALSGQAAVPIGGSFATALVNSLEIALLVMLFALAVGLPAGIAAVLYQFPGRWILLPLTTLPLLVPTFLWAIGWSALTGRLGTTATAWIGGRTGCVLVFSASAAPLVLWTTYAAAQSLSGTQVEAARLAGAERAVVRYAARFVALPAALAAALAGVLTLSDPGPGQILGRRTAASEVLTSFSSLYDFGLAGRQCLTLTLVVAVVTLPLAMLAAKRLSAQILARQTRPVYRVPTGPYGTAITLGFLMLIVLTIAAPLAGLLIPLSSGPDGGRAGREVLRTGANTLLYALGAGLTAACLAVLTAMFVGRSERLRAGVLGACLMLFALPPSLTALGLVQMATAAPPWLDGLLRSRLTVCGQLGLRFFPVAVVIALRSWGALSPSWTQAAALHGVPASRYLRKVVWPHLVPSTGATLLLVGLLATAEVGSVLLLHPPGQGSLPLSIFTVMANAPESLVASLCLSYVSLAFAMIALFCIGAARWIR
jgi:iron(III) transport system permease protein